LSATKTDIWMPVFIGDYLADTMHLSTEQHGAYLLLLFHLWRKGSLRDDDAELAKISGLSTKAWSAHRDVLAEFFKVGNGLWQHGRVEKERTRVAARQQAKASKAKLAASARWGKKNASGNAQALLEHADSDSDSDSDSELKTKDNILPLSFAAENLPGDSSSSHISHKNVRDMGNSESSLPVCSSMASLFVSKQVADTRHGLFRGILAEYWQAKNQTAPEMPWQGRDAKALSELLKACPQLNEMQFRQMLGNRAKSAVAHGDRVYLWIANLTRFQEEITVYNKPASAGGGHASRAEINRNSVVSAVDGALALAREHAARAGQAGAKPAAFAHPGVPAADGAGPGGCSVALPGSGDYGMASGDFEDGQAGADGSLSDSAAVTSAGAVDCHGRQEVTAW
jgi:uncharacterized protein YdaU (DUF1376 family)